MSQALTVPQVDTNIGKAVNDAEGWKSLGLFLLAVFVIAWINKRLAYGIMWVIIAILIANGIRKGV